MGFAWVPYGLIVGTVALGLVEFVRKREEYKNKQLRWTVFAVLVAMGVLTFVSFRHDKIEKEQTDRKADEATKALQAKVDVATAAENAAIQDQKNNTGQFLAKFGQLSAEVNELKQQVTTAELQKKLASVQAELQRTQKAMAPAPKAKLRFTFSPFINPPIYEGQAVVEPVVPVTDVELPAAADGSVHVEFSVLNLTEVAALNVSLTLKICDECKFAKEPEGFITQPGEPDTHRMRALPWIHAAERLPPMSVYVIPPPLPSFKIGIDYRCDTCALDLTPTLGTVYVKRSFMNPNRFRRKGSNGAP